MRARIGPEDPKYAFPPSVLQFIRAICPGDIKGEFRDDAYVVRMDVFCREVGMDRV